MKKSAYAFVFLFAITCNLQLSTCNGFSAEKLSEAKSASGGGLVAYWSFDQDKMGADVSGNGYDGDAGSARKEKGKVGDAMLTDGSNGLVVSSSEDLELRKGFSFECWIYPQDLSDIMNIITKNNEYQLRIDPPGEGGRISLFINTEGSWEPRVSTIKPEVNRWYYIVAAWDGNSAKLWINGQVFGKSKSGKPAPTSNPVKIGTPTEWARCGFVGMIDEVKFYNKIPTDFEIIRRCYLPGGLSEGVKITKTDFEFDKDADGWKAGQGIESRIKDSVLSATINDPGVSIINPALNADISNKNFISLRMSSDKGIQGKLFFITEKNAKTVPFNVNPDGNMHTYIFEVRLYREWKGNLTALGLFPSDESKAKVKIDFIRISELPSGPPEVEIKSFFPDRAVNHAQQDGGIMTVLRNTGGNAEKLTAKLILPAGITLKSEPICEIPLLKYEEEKQISWTLYAGAAIKGDVNLVVSCPGTPDVESTYSMEFTPPINLKKADYVPKPEPAKTKYLIGVNYFPGWKEGTHVGWGNIELYPERKPALGWYDEGSPEVADWEIKYALEHGISFFIYCWYRVSGTKDKPITMETMHLPHAIHEGLFKAKYLPMFKFCIMWENANAEGVASEQDLMENLMTFWMDNYFTHPSYLKIDNKPVLFILHPPNLTRDLRNPGNVRQALEKMREACRKRGLDGLIIIGDSGDNEGGLKRMKEEGYDYSSAYGYIIKCSQNNPVFCVHSPEEAIESNETYWKNKKAVDAIPDILTLSMGWDARPWGASKYPFRCRYAIPPGKFKKLCKDARSMMDGTGSSGLDAKMVCFDNWNEWGEGHYIAPCRQYGFGYLDDIREVFTDAPKEHIDIIPEDVGMGHYDSLYKKSMSISRKNLWEASNKSDCDAWVPNGGVEIKGTNFKMSTTTNDPQIALSTVLRIKADEYPFVAIRMKSSKPATGQLFWGTVFSPSHTEQASVVFQVNGDNEFHDYKLNVGDNPLWRGTVISLRFDPVSVSGADVEIEYIKLEEK